MPHGAKRLSEIAKEKHGSMYVNEDLIDLIWTDRPPMSKAPVMIFDNKYTGEDISSKLKKSQRADGTKRVQPFI